MLFRSQINQAIRTADVPVSITGAGSMFRIHLNQNPPNTYREAYQPPQISSLVNKLIDYMYHNEKIMLINTCSCMFSTALTQKEVDRLSEGFLRGFRFIKPELEKALS